MDISKLSQNLEHLKTTSTTLEPIEQVAETDVDSFLKNERMTALCNIVEATAHKVFIALAYSLNIFCFFEIILLQSVFFMLYDLDYSL